MELKVKDEYRNMLIRESDSEFQALKKSISENGVLEKIKVNKDGVILDGMHRYLALKDLGREPIEKDIEVLSFQSLEKEFEYVFIVNVVRRQLSDFAKVEAGVNAGFYKKFKDAAKDRQGTRTDLTSVPNGAEVGRVSELFGGFIGVTGGSLERCLYVLNSKFSTENDKERLRSGEAVDRVYKEVKQREDNTKLVDALPNGDKILFKNTIKAVIEDVATDSLNTVLVFAEEDLEALAKELKRIDKDDKLTQKDKDEKKADIKARVESGRFAVELKEVMKREITPTKIKRLVDDALELKLRITDTELRERLEKFLSKFGRMIKEASWQIVLSSIVREVEK